MNPLAFLDIGNKLIDKLIPDPAQKAAAQQALIKLQQTGDLDMLQTEMSVMLAEAKSEDPLTSRARPFFLYVMYIIILAGIPMGVVAAVSAATAANIAIGFGSWLMAIPADLWWLFGAGYLGYTAGRSFDKFKSKK